MKISVIVVVLMVIVIAHSSMSYPQPDLSKNFVFEREGLAQCRSKSDSKESMYRTLKGDCKQQPIRNINAKRDPNMFAISKTEKKLQVTGCYL